MSAMAVDVWMIVEAREVKYDVFLLDRRSIGPDFSANITAMRCRCPPAVIIGVYEADDATRARERNSDVILIRPVVPSDLYPLIDRN
jgi:hypothetical protein